MNINNSLKKTVNKENIYNVRESFYDMLPDVLDIFIQDKPMFKLDNFSAIFFDEYTLETNCHYDIFTTVYIEINQPFNYKPVKKLKKSFSNKIQIPELYITLEQIRIGIYESFLKYFDKNNILWLERDYICMKSAITEGDKTEVFYFKIIPCLTYYNNENIKGLMHYYNGQIDIEYPDLAINNFQHKNEMTDDVYRNVVLIFKNIMMLEKNNNDLPSEIIETMLYNVPTEMFIDDSIDSLLKIINYLRNNSIRDFKTLDEQDDAFTSIYRSMSLYYVKNVINKVEKYLTTK